ncbi:MAG: hypothetical protein GQ564_12835 [Bacteroidales bacterium]|nr:hypothetical protein [Bacteroidales bacterium]
MINTDNAILAMLMEQEELNVIKTKLSFVEKTVDNKQDNFHEGDDEPDPNVQGKFWMRNHEGRRKLHYWNSDTNQWELMTPTSPDDIGAIGSEQASELADRRIGARVGTQLVENDWTIGSGTTDFFDLIGNDTENHRVYGINPKGQRSVLWECRPDAVNDADGGWITKPFVIDKSKTYRFSVFIKTNNNSGWTYFGCTPDTVATLNTDTKNPSPYFWDGDLPENDKWYLIVGYIFPTGETGLDNLGGVYECETGKKITDVEHSFNWAADCISSSHKCSHYFNTNIETRQWMFNPRVDLIDGNEPSVIALLGKVEELGGVLSDDMYHTDNRPNMDEIPDGTTYHRIKGSEKTNLADGKKLDGSTYNVDDVDGAISSTDADDRISAKVGSDTEISYLRDGKKYNGSYIQASNIGAVTSAEASNLADSRISARVGTQLIENDWTIGSGATGFFTLNGSATENYRVYGLNPKGERSILWECRPDASYDADGGWNTVDFAIDKSKTYRFAIFVKTNSDSGKTYLGCKGSTVTTINTDTIHTNPYFWSGDLPQNNKWYLIIGYVFPAGQTGLSTLGGIYDCDTGKKVTGVGASFNWAANATISYHRCLHYYDTNTSTRQWMFGPRVDLIDGNEPSVMSLLGKVDEIGGVASDNIYHTGKKPNATDVGARPNTWTPTVDDLPLIPVAKVEDLSTRLDVMDDEVVTLIDRVIFLDEHLPNQV